MDDITVELSEESAEENVCYCDFWGYVSALILLHFSQDDSISLTSASTTDTTSRSGTPINKVGRRGKKSRSKGPKIIKPPFKFT